MRYPVGSSFGQTKKKEYLSLKDRSVMISKMELKYKEKDFTGKVLLAWIYLQKQFGGFCPHVNQREGSVGVFAILFEHTTM